MEFIGRRLTSNDMAIQYPGFPPFVHDIMASVANGATASEAVESVKDLEIDKHINAMIFEASKRPSEFRVETE